MLCMFQISNGHTTSPKRRKSQEDKSEPHTSSSPGPSTSQQCLLDELKTRDVDRKSGATFWRTGWRSKLCKCSSCQVNVKLKCVGAHPHDTCDVVWAFPSQSLLSFENGKFPKRHFRVRVCYNTWYVNLILNLQYNIRLSLLFPC